MNTLTESLKSELTRLDQEIGALQERRSKVAELLAPVVLSGGEKAKPARAARIKPPAVASATNSNGSAKPKGWPKGMPRDKARRTEWLVDTVDGHSYLNANGFANVGAYWAAQEPKASEA